jgi:hypothetical protein
MAWVETAVMLLAAIVVMAIILLKCPAADLRSVSAHWVAKHRLDGP